MKGPIFNPLSNIILQIVSVNFDNIASVSSSRPFIPDMENRKIPLLKFHVINFTFFAFASRIVRFVYGGCGFGRNVVSFKRFEHAISTGKKIARHRYCDRVISGAGLSKRYGDRSDKFGEPICTAFVFPYDLLTKEYMSPVCESAVTVSQPKCLISAILAGL